jgi:hypothetical protein
LIYKELQTNLAGVEFPREDDKDLSEIISGKAIPQVDTCALYSASQRANKGRKRHKHSGLTASIYMSDKLGGEQKGILVQTISWKKGPVIYQSIPDNRGETLRPMLDKYIPKNVPLFSDEGYKFYYRINKNHRMINHSLKSKDRRYKFSRERWSKNGIHTQCVEGHNRNLKYNFGSGYGYIKPKWSQMYLDEYAFWRNVKYYGWEALADDGLGVGSGELGNYHEQTTSEAKLSDVWSVSDSYSGKKNKISANYEDLLYRPLTLEERQVKSQPISRNSKNDKLQALLLHPRHSKLRDATDSFANFWKSSKDFQRAKQKQYTYVANALWEHLPEGDWCSLDDILHEVEIDRKQSYRILRRWVAIGLIDLVDRSSPTTASQKYVYDIRKRIANLPDILYVLNRADWKELRATTEPMIAKTYIPTKERGDHYV